MEIDKIIKSALEREVEESCSGTLPFPACSQFVLEKKIITKNHRSHIVEIGLAACFIIVFGITVFLKDSVYRSPLTYQGASIAQLFPENPGEAFYDFILAIHSSF